VEDSSRSKVVGDAFIDLHVKVEPARSGMTGSRSPSSSFLILSLFLSSSYAEVRLSELTKGCYSVCSLEIYLTRSPYPDPQYSSVEQDHKMGTHYFLIEERPYLPPM
jgi:hypothetical protein